MQTPEHDPQQPAPGALSQPPEMTPQNRMIPAERHGLKGVSMGLLTGDDTPGREPQNRPARRAHV